MMESSALPHATVCNTILGLKKQISWWHDTLEIIKVDNGTYFWNSLVDTCANEHGNERIYHIPSHAPAAGEAERCNGLLQTALKARVAGTCKNWDEHLVKATWLVNTGGSVNWAGPA